MLERSRRDVPGTVRTITPIVVIAVVCGVARALFLSAPMSTDEGGFLTVAAQWSSGHGGLYGHFWVGRPPLVIAYFHVADALGGLDALRLMGCASAATTVLFVGLCAHSTLGRRAGSWAAMVTGALLASPLLGALDVDGELIAAPFVAATVACAAWALGRACDGRALGPAAVLAGACAAAAVLVKQNMVDGFVFTAVLACAAVVVGRVPVRRMRRPALWFVAGAAAAIAVVMALAAVRGTAPGEVFYAMYPYRLEVAQLMPPISARLGRLAGLGLATVASLAPVVVVAFVTVVVRQRRARVAGPGAPSSRPGRLQGAFVAATIVLLAYACVSIVAGGSYWSHYLVELAVPLGCAAGVVATHPPRWARTVLVAPVVASVVACAVATGVSKPAPGEVTGRAIKEVAHRGDSIAVVLGGGDVVESSGLRPTYEYLWSLPAHVLDPRLRRLRALLAGAHRPTWFVVESPWTASRLREDGLDRTVAREYRPVSHTCGRTVYVLATVRRAAPAEPASCDLALVP